MLRQPHHCEETSKDMFLEEGKKKQQEEEGARALLMIQAKNLIYRLLYTLSFYIKFGLRCVVM